MNFFELMYTRAATLLRDVFQYLIPGLLFSGLIVAALQQRGYQWTEVFAREGDAWVIMLFIISCIIAYVIGQILFCLSDVLFPLYTMVWKRLSHGSLKNLDNKVEQLKSYLKSVEIEEPANAVLENIPIHLYFEMVAFVDTPELHARFVERYNVLMFMKRSFSSCFFFVCIAYLLILPQTIYSVAVEVVLFLLSLLLFWHYNLTEIGFLDRVFVSYSLAKAKMKGK